MNPKDLTNRYYSSNSQEYVSSTLGVNMQEHYDRFLPYLQKGANILDVGFGSGRDIAYFTNLGYNVTGIDIVEEFVAMATNNGYNAHLADFHILPYSNVFDGVWACASLLHSDNLPLAFNSINKALKEDGIAYVSMKLGSGTAIENGRFYQYVDENSLKKLCDESNFSIVSTYFSNDLLNRNNCWINAVLRKN